jgi:amino acid adenylation domain-containing protein
VGEETVERSIPARFERLVREHPQQIAVKVGNTHQTYAECNRAANRLARLILAERGEEEEAVALLLGHRAEAMSAYIGVLKAGKFFLPLNPNYPRSRITFMLEDSLARLLITDSEHLDLAHSLASSQCRVINIDEIGANVSDENLNFDIPLERLCYLVYTSGSTGMPKGVVHSHRTFLRPLVWMINTYPFTRADRVSLLFPIGYSASITNIFCALLSGATLLPYDLNARGFAPLAEWLNEEEITVIGIAPSAFRQFVEPLNEQTQFPNLRLIYFGGETVLKRDIESYKRIFAPHCQVRINLSCSETKAYRSILIDKNTALTGSVVPSGHPVDGAEVLLWDENGEDVGYDRVGEIIVKSRYLSPGYWRRPDLTQRVFLPDPNGGDERLYRTGDLGIMRPDGMMEYIGRKDFQVKIRGHRIEALEIEAALLEFAGINEAAVAARADSDKEDARLVAYVVADGNAPPTGTELRRFLQQRLPNHMIPSVFVFLTTLPRLPNGKVNRPALPAPEQTRPQLDESFVAPRDRFELELAQIWENILDIHPIGVTDKFLDLGGHSLLAARMLVEIEKKYGRKFPPRILYEASTVEQLAALLRQEGWQPAWSSLVPIRAHGSKPPLFYFPPINAVLSFHNVVFRLDADQPVYGLLATPEGQHNPYARIEDEAAFYVELMRLAQPTGPYYLAGYSHGGIVAFEAAQQLTAQGERVALLAILDSAIDGGGIRFQFGYYRRRINYLLHLKPRVLLEKFFLRARVQMLWTLRNEPQVLDNHWLGDRLRRRAYEPQTYPGRIVLFRTQDEFLHRYRDPLLGWGRLAREGVEVHDIPGIHSEMLFGPQVQELAEKFNAALRQAQEAQET